MLHILNYKILSYIGYESFLTSPFKVTVLSLNFYVQLCAYICLVICRYTMCIQVCVVAKRECPLSRGTGSCEPLHMVLGTKPGFYAETVITLYHWTISPTPYIVFMLSNIIDINLVQFSYVFHHIDIKQIYYLMFSLFLCLRHLGFFP